MKKINYVTGNSTKINYANSKLNKYGIEVVQIKLDIEEIQSHDKFGVAIDKAKKAFEIVGESLFASDAFWEIPALNGFPGAFMKYVNDWLTPEDFLNLMQNKTDRKIICDESIVFIDETGIKTFSDIVTGEIALEIYDSEKHNSIERVENFKENIWVNGMMI